MCWDRGLEEGCWQILRGQGGLTTGRALRCCVKKGVGKGLSGQDARCAGWGGSGQVESRVQSSRAGAKLLGLIPGPN